MAARSHCFPRVPAIANALSKAPFVPKEKNRPNRSKGRELVAWEACRCPLYQPPAYLHTWQECLEQRGGGHGAGVTAASWVARAEWEEQTPYVRVPTANAPTTG